jgi:hypothetical protein
MKQEMTRRNYRVRRVVWFVGSIAVPTIGIGAVAIGSPPPGIGTVVVACSCVAGLVFLYEALRKRPDRSPR